MINTIKPEWYLLKPNTFKLLIFMLDDATKDCWSAEEYYTKLNMSRGTYFKCVKELDEQGIIDNDSSLGFTQIRVKK